MVCNEATKLRGCEAFLLPFLDPFLGSFLGTLLGTFLGLLGLILDPFLDPFLAPCLGPFLGLLGLIFGPGAPGAHFGGHFGPVSQAALEAHFRTPKRARKGSKTAQNSSTLSF